MPDDLPSSIFNADFSAIAERNSVTFTWTTKAGTATTSLVGVLSPVTYAQRDVDPGWFSELDATLEVQLSQLSGTVARGDTFTVGSQVFQVMKWTTDPSAVSRTFGLDSNTK